LRVRSNGDSRDFSVEAFSLRYEGYDPDQEGLREVLTSSGNGRFCSRGAAEWEDADGVHYPGTYAHGVYNRETTILGGVPVLNEDLVNLPNWLVLKLRIEGEDAIRFGDVDLLDYRHELDLRRAVTTRSVSLRDASGRETTLCSCRFVSMAHPDRAGIEWTLTASNWSGRVEVVSAIDGRVANRGVARYLELEGRHLDPVSPRTFGPDVIALKVQTRQSNVYISQAARTRVFAAQQLVAVERSLYQMEDYIQQVLAFELREGAPVRVEKMVTLATSRDPATGDTLTKAGTVARRRPDFARDLARHVDAWEELWRVCDVRVRGHEEVQHLLRLHVCHVLQVCSRNTAHLDAGVPARGLNGEAYRGHVFWDELYVYPFLSLRLPEVTRGLLMYRYRRLEEARAAAHEAGFQGAMFPWQSGSEGTEETQHLHLNPISERWEPDLSHNQRHVNAAILYTVWRYFQATGDLPFLRDYGAEMMLEIARFWASIAHFNHGRGRYEIHGVMGPDEFHEKYPGAQEGGLRNNAYTNLMVAWLCSLACEVLSQLPDSRADALRMRLQISDGELELWQDMSRRMFVPFHDDGIISQFEGYDELQELDWDRYRERYRNIQRLDRILRAEGDDPDRYKISKQADVVMLFYLFSPATLRRLFERLGYEYRADTAARNIAYYDQRTSHGSTLSFVTFAGVLAALDPESSWERFLAALRSDAEDIQGGTTREGIHLGVMAGTVDLMQRAYPGTEISDGVLHFQPRLPAVVEQVEFRMQFQRTPLLVSLHRDRLVLTVHREGAGGPIRIAVGDRVHELFPGDTETFELSSPVAAGLPGSRT
jgi:trehalose/maltose hydrolase-like predicted phosphorylase